MILRTLAARPAPAAPFNLTRWFAIVGLVWITTVSTVSAVLLSNFLTHRLLRLEGETTMEFVQSLFATERSLLEYLDGKQQRGQPELEAAFEHFAALPDLLRANIYSSDRKITWSTDTHIIGRTFGQNDELDMALQGKLVVEGSDASKDEHVDFIPKDVGYFVEIYVPVFHPNTGKVVGVLELYKRPLALADALRTARLGTFIGAAAGGLFLYLALFGLLRRADAVMRAQHARLMENEILATVGEMGSAVAHGIRNPLAAIRSSAELATGASSEVWHEAAIDIISEADRLEQWVRSLLSYSRPLIGGFESVPVQELAYGAISHFARELEKRGIESSVLVDEALPPVKGDRLLLGQVLHSVIANAVEAMQRGGRLEMSGKMRPELGCVDVTINDTGTGMNEDQLARLFTPFYTTKRAGLGVGLSLAKRIVERFGGKITIQSKPGHGTAVRLSMPVA